MTELLPLKVYHYLKEIVETSCCSYAWPAQSGLILLLGLFWPVPVNLLPHADQ